ncbi:hypothetical protein ABGT24_11485 [Peribacillus frigoritolerans]|uniref:hypothetical protein n=1 Tax=Peribacillus frigoritolerans TaxID=450367 RepID=UPI00345D7E46
MEDKFANGELDSLDVIRRYGVIIDYATNKALPESTKQFRASMKTRSLACWK